MSSMKRRRLCEGATIASLRLSCAPSVLRMPLSSITDHSTISCAEVASSAAATLLSRNSAVGSAAMATLCGNDTKRLVGPQYKKTYIHTHQHAHIRSYIPTTYKQTCAHRYIYRFTYVHNKFSTWRASQSTPQQLHHVVPWHAMPCAD